MHQHCPISGTNLRIEWPSPYHLSHPLHLHLPRWYATLFLSFFVFHYADFGLKAQKMFSFCKYFVFICLHGGGFVHG